MNDPSDDYKITTQKVLALLVTSAQIWYLILVTQF